MWEASNKQEYAARTIRPKINKKLQEYLVEFPPVTKHPHRAQQSHRGKKIDWSEVEKKLKLDESVKPVVNFKPGERDISFYFGLLLYSIVKLAETYSALCNHFSTAL